MTGAVRPSVSTLPTRRPVNPRYLTSGFAQWTLDVHDVDRIAGFWSAVLGYRIERGDDGDAHLWPPSGGLSVWLQPTDQPRTTKNRNHPDLMVAGDRIIDAAHDVIAERGVAGTTHREIARAADVPLGSMTYHFTLLDEVLTEAFTRHADTAARVFDERLRAARDRDEAIKAVVTLISDDLINPGSDRDLILAVELYGAADRNPALRVVTQAWMARSAAPWNATSTPPPRAKLDAFIEGLALHSTLSTDPMTKPQIRDAVHRHMR